MNRIAPGITQLACTTGPRLKAQREAAACALVQTPQPRALASPLLCCLLAIIAVIVALPRAAEARREPEEDLVGIVIARQEVATLLVLRHGGRVWLPLDEFAGLTKMKLPRPMPRSGAIVLRTPLGETALPRDRTRKQSGVLYVDSRYLVDQLNFKLVAKEAEAALVVMTPWNRPRPDDGKVDTSQLKPEVMPPNFGVATAHGSMSYQATGSGDNVFDNAVRLTGFAERGVWQFVYEDDIHGGDRKIRDAVWMRELSPTSQIQLGHQSIALHPLMNIYELTGVQYAWSARPITVSSGRFYPGALLTRHGRHQRSFTGRGPVGGWAELWVNDLRVSRRDINLDGTYEFTDIPLASRQARIEIRVYDHHQPGAPVEIITDTLELAELLLDAGQVTVLTGAGKRGNAFDLLGEETGYGGGMAGFVFGRWGATDDITFEAAADLTEDGGRLLTGVIAQLNRGIIVTASGVVGDEGELGYDTELSAKRGRWQLLLNSFRALEKSTSDDSDAGASRYNSAELSYAASRSLEVGVLAREDDDAKFVLPFAVWSPFANTMIRVRPDRVGDYRVDAFYQQTPYDTYSLTVEYEYGSLSYTHIFRNMDLLMSVRGGYEFDDGGGDIRLAFAGQSAFGSEISWRAAVLSDDELNIGLELSLRRKLREGVIGYLDAASGHQDRERTGSVFGDKDDLRFRLGVSFDLAVTENGLSKAAPSGVRPDVGNIAGIVAPTARDADLGGIPILVDGKYRGRTEKDGSFFVPNIKTGNHVVEYEEDKLPLEHVAKKRTIIASVAPGAVTSMTFDTVVLYGAAGQVVDKAGNALAGFAVVVQDTAGKVVGESETNTFGYYRVDNLPPGSYRLAVRDAEGRRLASRNFIVASDYAFEVDLKVAKTVAAAKSQ